MCQLLKLPKSDDIFLAGMKTIIKKLIMYYITWKLMKTMKEDCVFEQTFFNNWKSVIFHVKIKITLDLFS